MIPTPPPDSGGGAFQEELWTIPIVISVPENVMLTVLPEKPAIAAVRPPLWLPKP